MLKTLKKPFALLNKRRRMNQAVKIATVLLEHSLKHQAGTGDDVDFEEIASDAADLLKKLNQKLS